VAIVVLDKTGHSSDSFGDIAVRSGPVAIPAKAFQIDLLQIIQSTKESLLRRTWPT
jgi:hypothetical protein